MVLRTRRLEMRRKIMVTNDATILRIKHDVLYEVAKLAWNGELDEEHKAQVPYTIIPGPQAQFRCCIYKEREIIRQRVRLAEGKCPTSGKDSRNVVQVIGAACEECPIASYTVTDNCRKCMGKACQNSCNFGAISMGDTRAHIDPNKCKETRLPTTSMAYARSMKISVFSAAPASTAVRSVQSAPKPLW